MDLLASTNSLNIIKREEKIFAFTFTEECLSRIRVSEERTRYFGAQIAWPYVRVKSDIKYWGE
jgi:hypothetical protein